MYVRHLFPLVCSFLLSSVQGADEINDDVVLLQQKMTVMENANMNLLQRLSELEHIVQTHERRLQVPYHACDSSPCDNGGSCVDVNVDIFLCLCRDGFFGLTCSESYADTAFLATFTTDPGVPEGPIVWNETRVNPAGYYDNTTGIYTVPIDGIYEFTVQIIVIEDESLIYYILIDSVRTVRGHGFEADYDDPSKQVTALFSLTAGQTVAVSPNGIIGMQGSQGAEMESWFAGHLVYPL